MEAELLSEGTELMLIGMGTVLVFLTILIGATSLMSTIVMKFQPGTRDSDDEEEIAAVAAAVSRYRQEH